MTGGSIQVGNGNGAGESLISVSLPSLNLPVSVLIRQL